MKNRAADALLKCGIPSNIKGFSYIVHAMELLDNCLGKCKTCVLYEKIAKDFGTTAVRVERAMRHAFGFVYTKLPIKEVEKYFDLANQKNGAQLACFYYRLCRERDLEGTNGN